MELIEIIMIVLGIIIVIVSCFLIDQSKEETIINATDINLPISEENIMKSTSKLKGILEEMSEDTVSKTDDYLSRISNEKIIAVNDFSEQILAKIKHNHEEVVFLYNMLCDKDSEIRILMQELEMVKKDHIAHSIEIESLKNNNGDIEQLELLTSQQMKDTYFENMDSNHNEQILELSSQGKSPSEIARLLGIGQGEIKLVIQLFSKLGGK